MRFTNIMKGKILSMTLKKIIAMLLVVAFAVVPLASCGGDDDTTTAGVDPNGGTESSLKAEYPLDEDVKFEGEKIRIYSRARSWFYYEMTTNPDEVANAIHQSVYDRELYVEEKLGIEITNDKEPNEAYDAVTKKVQTLFESDTDTYDIIANNGMQSTSTILSGYYYDFNETEYIDTSMPWYNQDLINSATVHDQLYCLNGYITLSSYQMGLVMFFNQPLLNRFHSGVNLYDEVDNHTWTLDRLFELVSNVYEDVDQNTQANEGDLYGLAFNNVVCMWSFWKSCDLRLLAQDENGVPYYGLDEERTQRAIEKLVDLYHNNSGALTMAHQTGNDGEFDRCMEQFASDLYMFAHLRLLSVESEHFTNMESVYGILPPPMLDSDQENYAIGVHDQFTLLYLMGTMDEDRLDVASAFIELMSWYSYCYTIDAYAEVALKGRYSRDEDSRRMIDIIVDNVVIEPGEFWSGIVGVSGATFFDGTVKVGNKEGLSSLLRAKKRIIDINVGKIDDFFAGV